MTLPHFVTTGHMMMISLLRKLQEELLKNLQTITEDQTALGHTPCLRPGNAEKQEGTLRPNRHHHHFMWANALLD